MTVAERLRALRGDMSQAEFARIGGVSQRTIGYYEKGERSPDIAFAQHICAEMSVSILWLLTGAGSMLADAAASPPSEPSDCVKMKRADTSAFEKIQHAEITGHGKGQKADRQPLAHEEELNSLNKELRDLLRQNGDLRVENAELRARVRDLERELREALKPEERSAPVASAG